MDYRKATAHVKRAPNTLPTSPLRQAYTAGASSAATSVVVASVVAQQSARPAGGR
jgi:hypothetical protein